MATILGRRFSDIGGEECREYVAAIPRFTYRKGFAPISPKSWLFTYTSDTHWGCCIRCAQSLLAGMVGWICRHPAFDLSRLFGDVGDPMALFDDDPAAPLSIHAFCRQLKEQGIRVGSWTTVSQIAPAITSLLAAHHIPVYTPRDSVFNCADALGLFVEGSPLLCLLPLMCGHDAFDPRCHEFVGVCVSIPSGLGAIIGKKGNALYLVGHSRNNFLFFDPHVTHDTALGEERHEILHNAPLHSVPASGINPSLMLGYIWGSPREMEDDLTIMAQLPFSPLSIVRSDDIHIVESHEELDSWEVIDVE